MLNIALDGQHAGEAPPPTAKLSLPYKVLRSLDSEVYRNVEFDVWQDTCKGEAGRWSCDHGAELLGGGAVESVTNLLIRLCASQRCRRRSTWCLQVGSTSWEISARYIEPLTGWINGG